MARDTRNEEKEKERGKTRRSRRPRNTFLALQESQKALRDHRRLKKSRRYTQKIILSLFNKSVT